MRYQGRTAHPLQRRNSHEQPACDHARQGGCPRGESGRRDRQTRSTLRYLDMRLPIFATGFLLAGLCHGASDGRLIDAVREQNRKAVESLIGSHADVNAAQPDGATALAWAVYLNQVDIANQLIKPGAKVNTADENGETPLTLAC